MSDMRKINTDRAYELGLDLMVDALTEDEVLVPVEPDVEAAAVAHAEYLGDRLPPRPDIYVEVKNILRAALSLEADDA